MSRSGGVTFLDAASARAAFALGPVEYRCLQCGQVHVSGDGTARRCLRRLAGFPEGLRGVWAGLCVPVPTPAYVFARYVWEEWPGWLRFHRFSLESLVPEWVLALDPYTPGLRAALREAMAEACERLDRQVDAAWEFREAFCEWFRELRGRWPPGRLCERNFAAGERLPRYILEFRVEPAVAPPWGWVPASVPISGETLWRSVAHTCALSRGVLRNRLLLFVEYGTDEFAAVFGLAAEGSDGAQIRVLLVCRERRGEWPVLNRVKVRGEDWRQELRRITAGLSGGGGSG